MSPVTHYTIQEMKNVNSVGAVLALSTVRNYETFRLYWNIQLNYFNAATIGTNYQMWFSAKWLKEDQLKYLNFMC